MSTNNPRRFSVIGCGRVGTALGVFLASGGFQAAAFYSLSESSARFARDMAGQGEVTPDAVTAVKAADLVFIATPDDRIETACRAIADQGGFSPAATVFHLSGALSSEILASAAAAGAATGSIHPLQAVTPYEPGQANPFAGINMSVEGSPEAEKLGLEIVAALGANAFTIPTQAKTLYHASAVVASNYLVTLSHMALELLMETGLDEGDAFDILAPLINGTLANIKARGSVRALTGPVARGDHGIVARHLAEIDEKRPQFSSLYRMLGRQTLAMTRETLKKEAVRELDRLFKDQ